CELTTPRTRASSGAGRGSDPSPRRRSPIWKRPSAANVR
ncbi:MAG: hypothetical protein AVDCRST_MAG89-911, partial [uncultured Gemmatimonadetes bacterium]